jgi:hypothetical protein
VIERKIKELSIALEALSRINALEAEFIRVNRLLDHAIHVAEEQNKADTATTSDDDIPF